MAKAEAENSTELTVVQLSVVMAAAEYHFRNGCCALIGRFEDDFIGGEDAGRGRTMNVRLIVHTFAIRVSLITALIPGAWREAAIRRQA